MTPVRCLAHQGISLAAARRVTSENGGCSESICPASRPRAASCRRLCSRSNCPRAPNMGTAGLAGFGAAVLLIVEHLIQPILIGGAARIPFLLVLIGIVGGMQSFGLLGLFLGPVIMAAHLTIWREWISP